MRLYNITECGDKDITVSDDWDSTTIDKDGDITESDRDGDIAMSDNDWDVPMWAPSAHCSDTSGRSSA